MTFYCDCDEECFAWTNLSTGVVTYRCNQMTQCDKKKKLSDCNLDCDYRHTIKLYSPTFPSKSVEKKSHTTVKKYTKEERCKALAESFLITQKLETFQELECLSGRKFTNEEYILNYVYSFINLNMNKCINNDKWKHLQIKS